MMMTQIRGCYGPIGFLKTPYRGSEGLFFR